MFRNLFDHIPLFLRPAIFISGLSDILSLWQRAGAKERGILILVFAPMLVCLAGLLLSVVSFVLFVLPSFVLRLLGWGVLTALFGSVIIFALIPAILHFAHLTEQAMHYLKYMMLINTYYIFGAAVNTTLIAGVFRAGGDSKFGMICDTIDMWCYAVPLGFLCAFVFKLPVMWVYVILCTDEFVKWPWVLKNYFSGKWIKNITRDDLYNE